MRNFDTGATRDSDENKYDIEAFIDPLVLESYAAFMHENRKQADGKLRDGDNWQKGIPKDAYAKSLLRHVLAVWKEHRGHPTPDGLKKELNAVLFNTMGYLHELIKEENAKKESALPGRPALITADDIIDQAAKAWNPVTHAKWLPDVVDPFAGYTHRYGALAHDQEAEENEPVQQITASEIIARYPEEVRKNYSESFISGESSEEQDTSLPGLSGLEHSEVLRVYPKRPTESLDTLAPQVRTASPCSTPFPI